MNFFDAQLKKQNDKYVVDLDGYVVELSEGKQKALKANNVAEQAVTLGVRPEHIALTDTGVEAKVDVHEMMGSSVHLHVTAAGQDVVLVVSTMDMTPEQLKGLASGNTLHFSFGGNNCHIFNKDTGINLEA